jgi:hypothetical protein
LASQGQPGLSGGSRSIGGGGRHFHYRFRRVRVQRFDGIFHTGTPGLSGTTARNWIHVPDLTSAAVPLYRKLNNQNSWFQYLSDSRTLYFKYNACSNAAALPFTTFTTEFLKTVDAFPVDRFVFDLRNNGGGDSSLIQPLLSALEQRYVSGQLASAQLYLLIGRGTFSSALLNALQLKEAPFAKLVGEPTGGQPNHYGNVSTGQSRGRHSGFNDVGCAAQRAPDPCSAPAQRQVRVILRDDKQAKSSLEKDFVWSAAE